MSPPCDIANDGNISDVLLVRCDRDELGEWNDRIAKLKGAANPGQNKKHREWFRKLVKQRRPGQHFLPQLPDEPRPLKDRRSDARREGKEEVSTGSDRGWTDH